MVISTMRLRYWPFCCRTAPRIRCTSLRTARGVRMRKRWWKICLIVLCCLLMPLENKERFVKAEGVELMIIIMKQKKLAIRALDFAMTKYPPACGCFGLEDSICSFYGKYYYSNKLSSNI